MDDKYFKFNSDDTDKLTKLVQQVLIIELHLMSDRSSKINSKSITHRNQ